MKENDPDDVYEPAQHDDRHHHSPDHSGHNQQEHAHHQHHDGPFDCFKDAAVNVGRRLSNAGESLTEFVHEKIDEAKRSLEDNGGIVTMMEKERAEKAEKDWKLDD